MRFCLLCVLFLGICLCNSAVYYLINLCSKLPGNRIQAFFRFNPFFRILLWPNKMIRVAAASTARIPRTTSITIWLTSAGSSLYTVMQRPFPILTINTPRSPQIQDVGTLYNHPDSISHSGSPTISHGTTSQSNVRQSTLPEMPQWHNP